jgi:ABC-2 type transport system permease protein
LQRLLDQQLYILAKQPIPAKLVWIDLTKQFAAPEARELNFNQTLLLLLIVMALAITGGLVVPLLVVEEKEKRTLDFLLISPAKLTDLIAGKALAGLTYAFLIVAVLLAFNRNVVGKRLPVLITIMFGAVLFVSMGLLIGSLFHSSMQVNTWGGFILFVLLLPAFGLSDLPVAIKSAIPFIPTYYFVDALKLSLGGARLLGILKGLAMTSFTCALAFSAATWILRRFVN